MNESSAEIPKHSNQRGLVAQLHVETAGLVGSGGEADPGAQNIIRNGLSKVAKRFRPGDTPPDATPSKTFRQELSPD